MQIFLAVMKIPKTNVARILDVKKVQYTLVPYVIPGDKEVDLKKAAKLSGNKKVEMILMKELLPLTGYIRGGCCPIGMKKPFPTWIHSTCTDFEYIYISAGVRGLQLKINPKDLVAVVGATIGDLISC